MIFELEKMPSRRGDPCVVVDKVVFAFYDMFHLLL